jgi:hypothetical protein
MLPMMMAVGAVGYCVWPFLQPPRFAHSGEAESKPIAVGLLEPTIEPAPARDPFRLVGASAPEAQESGPKSLASGPGTRPASSPTPRVQRGIEKPPAPPEPPALLGGWTLGATVVGRRRGAVVNGAVYREGELIPPAQPDGKALKLARVERDHVVLEDPTRPRFLVLAYQPTETTPKDSAPEPSTEALVGGALDVEPMLSVARGLLGAEMTRQLEGVLKSVKGGSD